eukprot:3933486-Rhodomonas_salina.2
MAVTYAAFNLFHLPSSLVPVDAEERKELRGARGASALSDTIKAEEEGSDATRPAKRGKRTASKSADLSPVAEKEGRRGRGNDDNETARGRGGRSRGRGAARGAAARGARGRGAARGRGSRGGKGRARGGRKAKGKEDEDEDEDEDDEPEIPIPAVQRVDEHV